VISSCLEALATGIDALFFPVTWVNLGGAGFWEAWEARGGREDEAETILVVDRQGNDTGEV
jgi:hypothetical protein